MEETGLKMPRNTKLFKNDASTLLTEKDKTGWTSHVSGWNGGLIFFPSNSFSSFWKLIKDSVFFLKELTSVLVYFLKVEMSLHVFESTSLKPLGDFLEGTYNEYFTKLFGDFPLLCIWAFFPLKHQNLIIVAEG